MNKLALEQIQDLEKRLLVKYDLKYEAMRNELLDHIACEIEEQMDEGETYDEATILTFRKWNIKLLSNKKGFYKGIPHFIVNQLNVTYRKVELKLLLLSIILSFALVLGGVYLTINKTLLLCSLFTLNGIGIGFMFLDLRGLKDYRIDFFKSQGLAVLLKTGIALIGVFVFHISWGKDTNTFSLDCLIVFYFLVNTHLLYRFRNYSKYQQFRIAQQLKE